MFADVDESLRALLIADMPVEGGEIDISFDQPTREWSSRLSKPTLNLYLTDVRERRELRDEVPVVRPAPNGAASKQRPPRRIDLCYMVTAWAREPADEHRILARVYASMLRHGRLEEDYLRGALANTDIPVLLRIMPPDYLAKPHELWGVLDNEMKAILNWAVTTPLDAFAPVEGPLVRTRETDYAVMDGPTDKRFIDAGGRVRHAEEGVAGVTVRVDGTGIRATTDDEGRFTLANVPEGAQRWLVELPDGRSLERQVSVPSADYDIDVS